LRPERLPKTQAESSHYHSKAEHSTGQYLISNESGRCFYHMVWQLKPLTPFDLCFMLNIIEYNLHKDAVALVNLMLYNEYLLYTWTM